MPLDTSPSSPTPPSVPKGLAESAAWANNPANKNLNILPTGNKPVDDNPIIEQLPNGSSTYDKGYTGGIESIDDYRYENQGWGNQLLNGGARLLGGSLLKFAEGVSTLGSAATVGAYDAITGLKNAISDDDHKSDYLGLDDINNNPVNNMFYGLEDNMKDLFHVYKPSNWDELSVGQQMSSTAWWADEGSDVLSFALSNLIPAGVIGDLGLGAKAATGLSELTDAVVSTGEAVAKTGKLGEWANNVLLSRAGLTNPIGIAKSIDDVAQQAYMTTSEAYFMSRDAGNAVTNAYLQGKGIDASKMNDDQRNQVVSSLTPEEQQELTQKKAQAEKYTFWSNMVALSATSHIEAGLVNKVFGHATADALHGAVDLGESLLDDAKPAAQSTMQKFLNTTVGSYVKNIPKYALTEGIYKANVQNAIQSIATNFGYTGKLDYIQQVAQKALSNIGDADAWKALMPNLLVGTIMGAMGAAKEQGEHNHAVARAVENINNAKENFVNLNNVLYTKNVDNEIQIDNEGKPIYNVPAILDYAANKTQANDLTQLHDQFKSMGDDQTAKLVKNELFTKYALAHLEAGLGDEFTAKIKALNSYKDEDLAKMGFDPINIDDKGQKITIQHQAHDLLEQANQIQKDYSQVSKKVGYVNYFNTGDSKADAIRNGNLQNSRINEAVKNLSRMRSLDDLIKTNNREVASLESNILGGSGANSTVETINRQARQLDAQKNAYEVGKQNGNIKEGSLEDTQLSRTIDEQSKAVTEAKQANKEELENLGYKIDVDDDKEISNGKPDSADISNIKTRLQDNEDAKIAKLGLQDRFDDITSYTKGADNFVNGIVNKKTADISEANTLTEDEQNHQQQLNQYKAGDNVAYGTNRATLQSTNDGGLHANGEPLDSAFFKKNADFRKMSDAEVQQENRARQKQAAIDEAQRKVTGNSNRLDIIANEDKTKSNVLDRIIQTDKAITNEDKGRIRLSEQAVTQQLDSIDKAKDIINKEIEELHKQGNEEEVSNNEQALDKLNQIQDDLRDLGKQLFPNLDEENPSKSNKEFNLNKEDIAKLKQISSDLTQVKNSFDEKVNSLNEDAKSSALELNKLLKQQNDKPEDEDVDNIPTVSSYPIPAIENENSLFRTAGANSKNGKLNEKVSQRVWGKYAEEFDPKNSEGHYLRTVTINDPVYGKGKTEDLFAEEPEQYQNVDNIKVLVLDKQGNPIYKNGSKVYTSLPEINDSKTEAKQFNFRNLDDNVTKLAIEKYRDFATQIKNSDKSFKLQITGKSNGRIVAGEPISASEAFGKALPLQIIIDEHTTIGGNDYPLPKGLVYVNYNGRPVGAESRTLTPEESKAVLDKLKQYAQLRGDKNAVNSRELVNSIKGTILLNSRQSNPDLSIYFVKGQDQLTFGDKSISTKDLIAGTYDDQLRQFLDNQNLQVDKSLLSKNEPFTDIFGKKWSSYQDYLLSPRENINDTPLTFKIAPKSEDINKPQFLNTYLKFSEPKNEVKQVVPQKTTTTAQSLEFDFGLNQLTSMTDLLNSKPVQEQIKPSDEAVKLIKTDEGNTIKEEESEVKPQTDLLDDLYLHKAIVQEFKPIDFEKEQDWFKKNISSSLPYDKVKGLIDKQAYGKFVSSGRVLISDMATEGTAYHEAFHVVSQLYLDDKERSALYNRYRTDTNNKEASDRLIEEGLAEEFRDYMLTKYSPYKTWFDRIVNFVKGLLGFNIDKQQQLFNRIATGYYADSNIKSSTDLDLYKMSDHLDSGTVKDVLDSMTLTLVRGIFKNNFTLNDIQKFNDYKKGNGLLSDEDADRFKNLYSSVLATVRNRILKAADIQENGEHLRNVADYLDKNKAEVQLDHISYLTKYGINLEVEPDTELPTDYQQAKDTLGIISAIEFSAKSGMPDMIKLMIGSLPKQYWIESKGPNVSPKVETVLNNLGLPQLSDYRRNTAILQNSLANISDFKDQIAKIGELAVRVPEFNLLLDQLGVSQDAVTPVNLNPDYFDLQSKFRQQFDKAYYNFYTQLYDGNNSYLLDANTDKLNSIIKSRWQGDAFNNKEAYKIVNGQYVLNSEYFKDKYSKQLKGSDKKESVLSFYKDLGITFTRPSLVDIDELADKQKILIKKMEDKDISSIFQDEAESKGFVNSILEQETKTSLDYSDNQHINPEGKTVYNVSLHNYLSKLASELNKQIPKELTWDETNQKGNPLMRHSVWADKLKSGKQIKINILEGSRVNESGETGTSTSDLTYPDAASQQFTAVLNGQSPFLRAGDKALEHSISFGDVPKFTSLDEATDYFKGTLADELLSSYMLNVQGVGGEYTEYASSAKDLRIFKDIFNSNEENAYKALINNKEIDRAEAIDQIDQFVEQDEVKKALQDWFDKYTEENKQVLLNNNLIYEDKGIHTLVGIPTELADKFVGKVDGLSENQMKSLVEQFTFNQLQGNIEQTKLFTGDLGFYKDFFKRTSGLTGTGKTAWVGSEIDEWLNQNRPREYQDYKGDIKIDKQSDSKVQTLVFKDVKSVSSNFKDYVKSLEDKGLNSEYVNKLLEGYNKAYDEADAQGYITLPEYREFLSRTGDWTSSHEVLYPKLIRGEQIKGDDLDKFLNGFPVLKPQEFGPQTDAELNVPTFYKFSVMPLLPNIVKGTELEELMHTMLDKGIGISMFQSANKVGGKTGNNLYDENGKINLDEDNLIQQEIKYDNLKIQLDISPKLKEKVIFGTQFRKLVLANLAGKTLTINGKTVNGNTIIKTYTDLINKTVELETKNLINKLGIEDAGNNQFRLKNPEFLRNVLSDLKRDVPDNLLEGIKSVLPKEGGHKQFDILVSRNKIENILMSLVNNNIVKQKTFGDMRVQGASTGFEAKTGLKGRSIADAQKSTWWSQVEHTNGDKGLAFYKPDENGTQPMEIYLPHYFKELVGKNVDISKLDERLLKVIGYRTPTQGLNSMELMKIKSFLPQEAGNLVVIPSEIVVKAGSDFDIDKLSLHFPNYEIIDGEPKYLEYNKETTVDSLPHIYNRINDLAWKTIAAPENFQQLITPNSNGEVEIIANEVAAMKETKQSSTDNGKGNNIGWKKNLDIRQAYLSGKEGIGIAAIHNTNHVLNQIVGLKAKSEVKMYLDHNQTNGQIDFSRERETGADPINSPTILDNLSAFLNGLVDMAKNPFLSTINTNIDTLPTYLYLIKAGVPLRQAIMFMNQPSISDYLTESARNNSLALKATDNKLSDEQIVQKVFDRYPATKDAKLIEDYRSKITIPKLEGYIKGEKDNLVQRQLLLDYLSYKDQADGLSDLIKATTADTKGTGATMNSAQDMVDRINSIKDTSIFDADTVQKYFDQTFIGSFSKAVETSTRLYKPLFYTEQNSIKDILSRVKSLVRLNKFADSEKVLNLAKNDIINYVLQTQSTDGVKLKDNVKSIFTGDGSIAKVLAEAKEHPAFKDNFLIRELFPMISSNTTNDIPDGNSLDKIKMFSKKLEAADSNLVTEGWKQLFEMHPPFAERLMQYTIMQSGLNNSPVSFTQYVPNEQYVRFASDLLQEKSDGFDDFFDKFVRNNYRDNDLVPQIKKFVMTRNGLVELANDREAFVKPPRRSQLTGRLLGRDLTKYDYVKAYNKSTNAYDLYRNTGQIRNDSVVFERISKLGDGYNLKEWTEESSILANRLSSSTNEYSTLNEINKTNLTRAKIQDMLEASALTEEQKQEFGRRLAEAKTDDDLGKLLKDICE